MDWVIVTALVLLAWSIRRVGKQVALAFTGTARAFHVLHDRIDAIEDHIGKPRSSRKWPPATTPAERLGDLYGVDR